jgi:phage host-nuclease inhibitor protein Gam
MASAITNIKSRIKTAATVWVAQSRPEVETGIRNIGRAQRKMQRIEAEMNDELAAIKERFEKQAKPHREEIERLQKGVQAWCEANRDQITNGGKTKTVAFTTGEINWRTRPPSCGIRGAEAVMDALKRLGLSRFIRSKEEINKEAILNEPDAVKGVAGISIVQGEDFNIEPFGDELEAA